MGVSTDHITGTADTEVDLLWFTSSCLDNVLRLASCVRNAEDSGDTDAAELFRKAQHASRRGAETGKRLLAARLAPLAEQPGGERTREGQPEGGSEDFADERPAGREAWAPDVRGESPPEHEPTDAGTDSRLPQDPEKP
ncbi:hypothetical protein ACIRBX_22230 [Kitasatospora sp. NPDC096147]|uniref:hypothetical protein n=1 Tax=Kitasatospora sp. NPDC096147 TaxID=3364093 RepID=UPI0038028B14